MLLEKAAACIASTVKASCMGLSWASSISKLKNMKGNKISLSLGNILNYNIISGLKSK